MGGGPLEVPVQRVTSCTFGGSNRGSGDHSWGGLAAGQEPAPFETEVPEGLVNVCPNAGDFVIMPESTTHGVLPWRGKGQRLSALQRAVPSARARSKWRSAPRRSPRLDSTRPISWFARELSSSIESVFDHAFIAPLVAA